MWYRWDNRDLLIQVRVQPRACRDEFTNTQDGCLRVRITAPPIDGKANAHLRRFLGRAFGVPNSRVTLLCGQTSRDKWLRISEPRCLPLHINSPDVSDT